MDIVTLREYCISKKGASESFPFGDDTLVFKVNGKIFALVNLEGNLSINLKCDPAFAIELRERFSSVTPGYHMNKILWFLFIPIRNFYIFTMSLTFIWIFKIEPKYCGYKKHYTSINGNWTTSFFDSILRNLQLIS